MSAPASLSKLPPFTLLDEPKLSFSPSDAAQVDVNPLRGLATFGPYSKGSFGGFTPRIRIATIGPESDFRRRGELMLLLRNAHPPTDRSEYVPQYPGFERLFQVALEAAPRDAHVKWPDHISKLPGDGDPQARLYLAMESALRRLETVRNEFDVALVHFPDSWDPATRGKFFDAHDSLKALGAKYNIPTQVLNDRAFTFSHKASLAWRLAIALYVKAAGTPWKLAPLSGVCRKTSTRSGEWFM